MNFDEYQEFTNETALYGDSVKAALKDVGLKSPSYIHDWMELAYPIGKLNGEAGELAEAHFKALRDDGCILTPERRQAMTKELGDVLYYVARIAIHLGVPLDDIAVANMQKLRDRKDRGVLQGSGSDR